MWLAIVFIMVVVSAIVLLGGVSILSILAGIK